MAVRVVEHVQDGLLGPYPAWLWILNEVVIAIIMLVTTPLHRLLQGGMLLFPDRLQLLHAVVVVHIFLHYQPRGAVNALDEKSGRRPLRIRVH